MDNINHELQDEPFNFYSQDHRALLDSHLNQASKLKCVTNANAAPIVPFNFAANDKVRNSAYRIKAFLAVPSRAFFVDILNSDDVADTSDMRSEARPNSDTTSTNTARLGALTCQNCALCVQRLRHRHQCSFLHERV